MQELWFLRSARPLMLIDIYIKFCEDSERFSSNRADTILWQTDRRIDRRTGGVTICLPTT